MYNASEVQAVRDFINDNLNTLKNYCLFDAMAECSFRAYENLYGPVERTIGTNEYDLRMSRLGIYADDLLLDRDKSFAETDDRASRDIECFMVKGSSFYLYDPDETRFGPVNVIVSPENDGWVAREYDFDGDLSHEGHGSDPREALANIRRIDFEL